MNGSKGVILENLPQYHFFIICTYLVLNKQILQSVTAENLLCQPKSNKTKINIVKPFWLVDWMACCENQNQQSTPMPQNNPLSSNNILQYTSQNLEPYNNQEFLCKTFNFIALYR